MTGVEERKGGGEGENNDLSATDDVQQNGTTEKAPVVTGTNMETLPRSGKQSDPSTAFLRAARAGQLEKVLEFLESGVDINASNANGLNALHLAAKDGHLEIVRELLTRGAIVDAATKKGNTALHIASLAGQEEVVQLLVQRGASVNAQSQNGFTPLYMAAQENHDSVVRFLLSKDANQTLATEDGFTPLAVAMQQGHDKVVAVLLENDTRGKVRLPALHIAAKKDDCKAAALLLQNDHNPDVTSKSGFTPLHIAAHYGNDRIASLLYDKGADVNFAAKHNITPMHVAAKWGKIKMVNLLMSKGANIAAKTRDGLTPLHCAARAGHHEVVDILIEKGAPIGAKTKNGLAPLHMASQGDHVDAARILLYHRAPVDEVTVDYLTALHVAAHCGHVRVAKLLLDRNADPNARALNGFTPLHIACKKNRAKVVELLLKNKASIEATTESGLTPLHVASFMGCMNIVIYLLQNEASPDIPTVRGETPLHLAARANQTDIIRILLRNGAQVDARAREEQTPLHVASRLGNVDIVMLLLQHGANVNATTKDLYTPLHIAAKEGQEEVASVLLENGASLNAMTKKGFTPLHLAAKYGNMNVARLLLQKNAPVDAQGKNGVTPLHVASHYDHQNVALLLLDKGASPHAMAKNGHTPLHIAARKNQMDIATTLLEYGAKANAESKAGFTPLHLSAQEGHTDMSTLLIEHKADINHKAKNGLTPLHLCAQEDKMNVATILVKNGAQVDAKTKAGYTPLHVACHFGQVAMVRFLLRAGAAVDTSTGAGYTPLHQAAQQGHSLVINLLLESKAKPNAVTNNGQTALAIAQKLGYISVVETLKVVTETVIMTTQTTTIEEKYRVQAPESMQETFMSDSEDEGGGDEIGIAAMNVYGQPTHAQHVYLPSYYQGQMTYTREDPMLSDQQQYRYMTVDDMKSMGDDSMRVNVTDDERDNRHSGGTIVADLMNKESYYRSNAANLKPDNIDINRHPVHVGPSLESLSWSLAALGIIPKGQGMWRDSIPSWKNFLVSFLVDARGGAMRGCRHSGVRVIVPPRKAAMPMRITCRYLKRDKLTNPPPLMEGEALASRILELGPIGAKFLGPVIIEVPHFASLRGKEREIVILRSDNGETWREHTLEASEEAVQDVLNESFEGEELSQLEDLQTSRIVRILTVDFPHYFAVVSRIRQEVHAVGPEGGTVSSSAVPQVQAVFPPAALTKKIRVGLQAHPISAELVAKLLGNRVAVSPIVTVEPRRRKFHKPITLTIPVPQAANKGMINQYSGDAPTLRLLCSITGGQSRAVWEDVTGSTPLTFVKDCVSFTTTVSARFWLMDCRNITDATRMATELYTHATHVPFMAKFVVFAKRVDPLEARLRVFCMTDDKEDKTLEHQEHFTEVAKSRDVEVLEGKTQYMEFAGNLVPVLKSGEQLQLPFRAFKENRVPFTARIKDPDAADMVGRIMFMNEPKIAKGEPPQTPICTLNILLPDKISPEIGHSELDLLELSKNYSFLRDGGLSRPDTIHRATIRLTDIANLLDSDWEKLAEELNISPNDVELIKREHVGKPALQAATMFKLWQNHGNKATGNTLEKALNKIGREDIVKKCIFNVELVTDDVEKAVARVRLDQPGFDSLKDELGSSRDSSLKRDESLVGRKLDYEELDHMKDSESIENLTSIENVLPKHQKKQHITITNGTVFNSTSTPVKNKYASEEKDIGDDMAEFLEHKYHITEKMTKKTQDEINDDNRNRQKVIEDANRLVTGILQDAEKEKKCMMEGVGVSRSGGKEAGGAIDVLDNNVSISLAQSIRNTVNKDSLIVKENFMKPSFLEDSQIINNSKITSIPEAISTQTYIGPDKTSTTYKENEEITKKPTTAKEMLDIYSNSNRDIDNSQENIIEAGNRHETPININVDDYNDNQTKKKEKRKILPEIFKRSKLREEKTTDSQETSAEGENGEFRKNTEFIKDTTKNVKHIKELSADLAFNATNDIMNDNKKLIASSRHRQLVWSTADFLYDAKKSAEKFISDANIENNHTDGIEKNRKQPEDDQKTQLNAEIHTTDQKSKYETLSKKSESSKKNDSKRTKTKLPTEPQHSNEDRERLASELNIARVQCKQSDITRKTEIKLIKKKESSTKKINKDNDRKYDTLTKEKTETPTLFFGIFKSSKTEKENSSSSRDERSLRIEYDEKENKKVTLTDKEGDNNETDRKNKENNVAHIKVSEIMNTIDIVKPEVTEELKLTSDEVNSSRSTVEREIDDSLESIKNKTSKEAKKAKDKSKGFFSGIFKGVKHAADEVVDDVKEFVDETKKEAGDKGSHRKEKTAVDDGTGIDDHVKVMQEYAIHATGKENQNLLNEVMDSSQKAVDKVIQKAADSAGTLAKVIDKATCDVVSEGIVKKNSAKDEVIEKIENDIGVAETELSEEAHQLEIDAEGSKRSLESSVNRVVDGVYKPVSETMNTIDIVKPEVTEELKLTSDEVNSSRSTVEREIDDSLESIKNKTSKEAKKAKDKSKGFFSGIFKGVKHAADEVVDDVKEFVDETKKEAGDKGSHRKEKTAVDDGTGIDDHVKVMQEYAIHATGKENQNLLNEVMDSSQKAVDKVIQKAADSAGTLAKVIDKATCDVVSEGIVKKNSAKDEVIEKIENDIGVAETELSEEAHQLEIDAEGSKRSLESSVNRVVDGVYKPVSETMNTIDIVKPEVTEELKLTSDEVNSSRSTVEREIDDSLESIKNKTSKEAKKAKDKSKGFFSGIFKGVKHAADEVVDDVKEFVDETKKEAGDKGSHRKEKTAVDDGTGIDDHVKVMQEYAIHATGKENQNLLNEVMDSSQKAVDKVIQKAADSAGTLAKVIDKATCDVVSEGIVKKNSAKDEVIEKIENDIGVAETELSEEAHQLEIDAEGSKRSLESSVNRVVDGVYKPVSETMNTIDIVKPEVTEELKLTSDEVNSSRSTVEREIDDSLESIKNKTSKEAKKAKDKSKGFFSGIFKGVKHAADEVVDDVKEFVDETKKEAGDKGSHRKEKTAVDDGTGIDDHVKVMQEYAIHATGKENQNLLNEVVDSVKEFVDETKKDVEDQFGSYCLHDRVSTGQSLNTANIEISHELGHLEPRVDQSVSTVFSESVRLATASSPFNPEELGDCNIEDVTEEATIRARIIANQDLADMKSESNNEVNKKDEMNTPNILDQDSTVMTSKTAAECISDDTQAFDVNKETATMADRIIPIKEKFFRSYEFSTELKDILTDTEKLENITEYNSHGFKTTQTFANENIHILNLKDERVNEQSTSGVILKETIRTISTKSSWDSSRSKDDQDNWDQTQFSLDTPSSGDPGLTKNGGSRHELSSDSDSEGSSPPRRQSLSKRRTLGSSSGSDVALHEGAELSPLEDDQGTSLTTNSSNRKPYRTIGQEMLYSMDCIQA
ncbi:uncharacterized protein [Chelonus insularis]|uniref:uncharacterized protein isoform X2 n=1 Tax=Chelonus insularis TaxID=460826 RepID=UPI00158EA124|nr:uncharacterized protein LOC118063802 isoform X2 [Chelonus insularis]